MFADPTRKGTRGEPLAPALVAIPLIVERALLIGRQAPTGSDETLYLMMARSWLGRLTKISFDPYQERGVAALIYPLVALTDATVAYRIEFALLSLVLCVVTYLVGREFLGRVVAAWSALMLGLFGPLLIASVSLLPDLVAAIGVTTAFLVYWKRVVHSPEGTPLRRLWPIALAIASVFFFNIAFAAFAGAAIVADFLIFRRRDLFARATIAAALTLGVVLVPYFIKVWIDHGNPLYTIRRGLAGTNAPGVGPPGYETYARWFFDPDRLFGPFWGVAIIVAVVTLGVALVKGMPVARRDAAALALWLVIPVVLTAVLSHGEERYLIPWMPAFFLTLALPVSAAIRWARERRWATIAIMTLVLVGTIQFALAGYARAAGRVDSQRTSFALIHAVAERLVKEGAPRDCVIFVRWPREFELHTGCRTATYTRKSEARVLQLSEDAGAPTYYVWWRGLRGVENRQPAYLEDFYRAHAVELFSMDGPGWLGPATVYKFTG